MNGSPVVVTMPQQRVINMALPPPLPVTMYITGPQGAPGSAASLTPFEQVATTDGAQEIALPKVSGAWSTLCINGLQQSRANYVLVGNTLSIPAAMMVMAGDLIALNYEQG